MAVTQDFNVHTRRVAYSNTLALAVQQKTSRIWDYCEEHDVNADDGLSFDEMAANAAPTAIGKTANRFDAMQIKELSIVRRWLQTSKWDDVRHWVSWDETKTLTNVTSPVIQSFRQSFNRLKDKIVIDAMFGAAKRGMDKPGDDDDAVFDATNQVVAVNVVNSGSATNTGLNRAKLNQAWAILVGNEVIGDDGDGEEVHCAIARKQLEELLIDDKVTDRQFLLGQFNQTGQLRYLNIMFHNYQSLLKDGSSYYRVPMWVKSGIRRGVTKDLTTDLSQRRDIRGLPWQAYAWAEIGAARTDEKKIVEIKCV